MVFADVVHSMDIAAAVGKHLREIMTGGCGEALQRHGRQVTGDCSLAVFGAPVGDGGPRNLYHLLTRFYGVMSRPKRFRGLGRNAA